MKQIILNIPIIIIITYFIPWLGILLALIRVCLDFHAKRLIYTLLIASIFLQLTNLFFKSTDFSSITTINTQEIISSSLYLNIINFSKALFIVGIIMWIILSLKKAIYAKVTNGIFEWIQKEMQVEELIKKENNLKIQEKQLQAKNTHVTKCKYCGADNILKEKIGICKYCRKPLE